MSTDVETLLANVKAGDEVLLRDHGIESIKQITRVTPKQIVIQVHDTYTRRFAKDNGKEIGASSSGWGATPSISIPTQKDRDSIERKRLIASIQSMAGHLNGDSPLGSLASLESILRSLKKASA